ncbi:MAG: hypothetical protein OEZ36_09360 [Spirochaetota bacterium]|nr:hypothetical protein [Spirochaetota bacterium]
MKDNKIITFQLISFVVDGNRNKKNLNNFIKLINNSKSDIIVFSGWSLYNAEDLKSAQKEIQNEHSIVFFEIFKDTPDHQHRGYVIKNGILIKEKIEQIFAQSTEVNFSVMKTFLDHFENNRIFEIKNKKIGWLICGELNYLKNIQSKGNEVQFRLQNEPSLLKHSNKIMKDIDIFINPIHTPMGNQGKMHKRREYLSKNNKAYCSVSNFDLCKDRYNNDDKNFAQRMKSSKSLQYCYFNSKPVNCCIEDSQKGYVSRTYKIEWQ